MLNRLRQGSSASSKTVKGGDGASDYGIDQDKDDCACIVGVWVDNVQDCLLALLSLRACSQHLPTCTATLHDQAANKPLPISTCVSYNA